MSKQGPTPKRQWQRMERAVPVDPEAFRTVEGSAQMWKNDRYTVIENCQDPQKGREGAVWLSVRRNDRKPIRDWRDLQRIKNDICGEEREALELFPAESRLVDTANQFHLWVMPEGVQLPIGFNEGRVVTDHEGQITLDGEVIPDDVLRDEWAKLGAVPDNVVAKAVQRPRDQEN